MKKYVKLEFPCKNVRQGFANPTQDHIPPIARSSRDPAIYSNIDIENAAHGTTFNLHLLAFSIIQYIYINRILVTSTGNLL